MRRTPRYVGMSVTVFMALALAPGLPPAARAGDGDAVAIVNGRPISKQRLIEVLMDAHGLEIMQQLIILELAKTETQRRDIRITQTDTEREFERALAKIAPEVDARGSALNDREKRQSLTMLLQQKGITLAEFVIAMERNAHLRKLVERDVQVTESTLREEFARIHGEKVQVRHIQVAGVEGLHEALNQLDQDVAFADVARAVSQNNETAPRGGLLEPFAFNDESVSRLLRDAAFALKKVGEVTKPILVGRWWHILQLERRISSAGVRFEDVRHQVEQELLDRVVPREMNRLVTEMFEKARQTGQIRVLDGELKWRFERLLAENAPVTPAATP